MKLCFPDYENCIANLANSVLAKFGVCEDRQKLVMLEPYLERDYENVVVILLDGMGKCIIQKNLDKGGFFNSHLAGNYSSVFPPTTVAATASMANGLMPCEHNWLGWDCYYPQIDKNVTVFLNQESGTEQPAADYNVAWTYCGYESVVSRIRANGGSAHEVTPFVEPYPDSFEPRALNLFVKEGRGKQLEYEFQKQFGDKFLLLTREQVLEQKIFGTGKEHPDFQKMLGDYLAVAASDLSVYNTREEADYFVGVHAGLTEDEMQIPLIIIERG